MLGLVYGCFLLIATEKSSSFFVVFLIFLFFILWQLHFTLRPAFSSKIETTSLRLSPLIEFHSAMKME